MEYLICRIRDPQKDCDTQVENHWSKLLFLNKNVSRYFLQCTLTINFLVFFSLKKDCIRNIQGSLLCSDLYENWLNIPNEESLVGKISIIKR